MQDETARLCTKMRKLHKNSPKLHKIRLVAQKNNSFGKKYGLGLNSKRKPKQKPQKEGKRNPIAMTVCVAALCDNGKNVVGFADSMVTANNIETELVAKIIPLARSVIVMLSGDADLNAEILYRIRQKIGEYDAEKMMPYEHNIKDIAELYRDTYLQIRSEKIEKEIISLYGLDLDAWKTQQNTLSPELIRDIINRIEYFEMPKIEVIVMGADKSVKGEASAHIFVVENDKVICRDLMGYACVGIGGEQAELEFLQKGYSIKQPFEIAALTASLAKRRAEKVTGVGKETSIVFVIDEKSTLAKSGILTNGLLLERIEIAGLYKTFGEIRLNLNMTKLMSGLIKKVEEGKLEEIREDHRKILETVDESLGKVTKVLNEKPSS